MSASTWDGPQLYIDEVYPPTLLKHLLKNMMTDFSAQGACIALFDETSQQMRVRLHVRSRVAANMVPANMVPIRGNSVLHPRRTVRLEQDTPSSREQTGPLPHPVQQLSPLSTEPLPPLTPPEELDEIPETQSELFAVGTCYPFGGDLIGAAWLRNDVLVWKHDEYLANIFHGGPLPFRTDVTPTSYLVVPIRESTLVDDMRGRRRNAQTLGVIVLYQLIAGVVTPFHPRQRAEALHYVERIALYLQNDKLERTQRRTNEYLKRIKELSAFFPSNVEPSKLANALYTYASQIVNISSLLFTLYDRDTDKIYEVMAIRNGEQIDGLADEFEYFPTCRATCVVGGCL